MLTMSVLVAKDALTNENRYYLHRTHVGNEIQQCRVIKQKYASHRNLCLYLKAMLKLNICIVNVKNVVCHEM